MSDLDERLRRMADEAEIKALALAYAKAVDRRDAAALTGLFTEDATIAGAGVDVRGREQIRGIPKIMADRFDQTYHTVLNHLVEIEGDLAAGEVYSAAHHLNRQDDGRTRDWVMVITYVDQYVREAGAWRFAHRGIEMKWTETHWVEPGGSV